MKTHAEKRVKIVEKATAFHNFYLMFFYPKNTISCGLFSLPTKHIVLALIPLQLRF
jgi:hypothetical protein